MAQMQDAGKTSRFGGMRCTRLSVILVVGVLVASASGCSSSGNDKSSEVCTQKDAVAAVGDQPQEREAVRERTPTMKTDLQQLKTDVQALGKSLGSELKPDVQAVKSSFTTLDAALGSVTSNGLAPVGTAVKGIGQSTDALVKKVQDQKCS